MMSKETGEMRPATDDEIQLEKLKEVGMSKEARDLEVRLDAQKFIMFKAGEEFELKGHKFKVKHIDVKHHTLVLVSTELNRVF